jgi:hypothetical protein
MYNPTKPRRMQQYHHFRNHTDKVDLRRETTKDRTTLYPFSGNGGPQEKVTSRSPLILLLSQLNSSSQFISCLLGAIAIAQNLIASSKTLRKSEI